MKEIMKSKWGNTSCVLFAVAFIWGYSILVILPYWEKGALKGTTATILDLVLPVTAPVSGLGAICGFIGCRNQLAVNKTSYFGLISNLLLLVVLILFGYAAWHSELLKY
jgi:hypothetical protein